MHNSDDGVAFQNLQTGLLVTYVSLSLHGDQGGQVALSKVDQSSNLSVLHIACIENLLQETAHASFKQTNSQIMKSARKSILRAR